MPPVVSVTRRRTLALALLLAYLSACMRWQVAGPTPAAVISGRTPAVIRVTRTDATAQVLYSPTLLGDSVVGRRTPNAVPSDSLARLAVPLATIRVLEIRKLDVLKTAGAAVGGAFVFALFVCVASQCLKMEVPQ